MNANEIVKLLKNKKGQHVSVIWSREAKTYKNCPVVIGKRTRAFVRAGIDYANLASVKQEIESGRRGAVQPLSWGKWEEFPFIITHNGLEYVRLYSASFVNLRPQVEWTKDGVPTTKWNIEEYLLASEKREDSPTQECFTVKCESIIEIDGTRLTWF